MSESATLELPVAVGTSGVAEIEVPAVGCPKCGSLESWGRSSWCPECGYYPRLGTSVSEPESGAVKAPETTFAPKSPLDVWQHAPSWMKVLIMGVLAIFGASIAARFVTPDKSIARSLWGTLQLLVGLAVFIVFHVLAAAKASFKNNHASFMDAVIHPFDVWRPTIHELPGTARRLWLASWGLTAVLCAMTLIGGIRYSVLVDDWGFRQRAQGDIAAQIKAKAMEAAMAGAKQADSLEDAVKNAAAKEGGNNEKDSELEMLSSDCVVIGYNVNPADGMISELILASTVDNELKYVGTLRTGIPDDVLKELQSRLPGLKRQTPFLKCSASGVWVRPVVTCRTKFKSWTDDKLMRAPTFKELLADVKGG